MNARSSGNGRVLSIGQGSRQVEDLVAALRRFGVQYLLDVRSAPYSRHRPEFSREPLDTSLKGNGIKYVYVGDVLGGRPSDATCYAADGHVDYGVVREKAFFKQGIARVQRAFDQGLTVCLMCAEGEPGQCHRSKLVGAALADVGVEVGHIKPDGMTVASQAEVMLETGGRQATLFGEAPSGARSRKAYG